MLASARDSTVAVLEGVDLGERVVKPSRSHLGVRQRGMDLEQPLHLARHVLRGTVLVDAAIAGERVVGRRLPVAATQRDLGPSTKTIDGIGRRLMASEERVDILDPSDGEGPTSRACGSEGDSIGRQR
jgi:hypothetical protein